MRNIEYLHMCPYGYQVSPPVSVWKISSSSTCVPMENIMYLHLSPYRISNISTCPHVEYQVSPDVPPCRISSLSACVPMQNIKYLLMCPHAECQVSPHVPMQNIEHINLLSRNNYIIKRDLLLLFLHP